MEHMTGACVWFRMAQIRKRYDLIFPNVIGLRTCAHYAVRPDENGYCRDPRQEPLL